MTDKTYTLTEILADVVETLRMVQVSIDGRTAMSWDDWVAHLDDAFSEDLTPNPSPSGEVVERVGEVLNAHKVYRTLPLSSIDLEEKLNYLTQAITPIIEAEVQRRREGEHCPNCPDQGWFIGGQGDEPEQVQCEFCYTNTNSIFYRDNLASQRSKA